MINWSYQQFFEIRIFGSISFVFIILVFKKMYRTIFSKFVFLQFFFVLLFNGDFVLSFFKKIFLFISHRIIVKFHNFFIKKICNPSPRCLFSKEKYFFRFQGRASSQVAVRGTLTDKKKNYLSFLGRIFDFIPFFAVSVRFWEMSRIFLMVILNV